MKDEFKGLRGCIKGYTSGEQLLKELRKEERSLK